MVVFSLIFVYTLPCLFTFTLNVRVEIRKWQCIFGIWEIYDFVMFSVGCSLISIIDCNFILSLLNCFCLSFSLHTVLLGIVPLLLLDNWIYISEEGKAGLLDGESPTRFKRDLVDYLTSYKAPDLTRWSHIIKKYDFTNCK